MKNSQRRQGFTLIELLVVIAIIAILAAILFPVFTQAKVSAKKTVMVSNMKQNLLAQAMYSNDADDMFALKAIIGYNTAEPAITWDKMIQPYMKAYPLVNCSEDTYPKAQHRGSTQSLPRRRRQPDIRLGKQPDASSHLVHSSS
jgi:prepilin-type N-terminal cleavage/methylation domain-containing protein